MVTNPFNYHTRERIPNYLLHCNGMLYRLRKNRKTPVYPVFVEGIHWRTAVNLEGKQFRFSLYRLLWETFIGKLEQGERVYSLTGKPNLEDLVTRKTPRSPILRTALGELKHAQ